jgi:hypothetical protein
MLDPVQIVREQHEACRQNLVVTSRARLVRHLVEVTGIPRKDAFDVVDNYCEVDNVAVPMYLGRDFTVGWLKVIAVSNVIISLILLWNGRQLHLQKIYPWWFWLAGACFGGLGVLFWVKSLELEVSNAKKDGLMGGKDAKPKVDR